MDRQVYPYIQRCVTEIENTGAEWRLCVIREQEKKNKRRKRDPSDQIYTRIRKSIFS